MNEEPTLIEQVLQLSQYGFESGIYTGDQTASLYTDDYVRILILVEYSHSTN